MFAKLCLLAMVARFASASLPHHGGHSNQFRKQDDHGNYAFGYDIVDPHGAKNFRKESGDAWGNKAGSYGIHDIDGRLRIVEYVADAHGFRAKIKTNEPGTANKDSAAVIVNGPDGHGFSHTDVPAGHVAPQFNHGAYTHGHAVHAIAPHHYGGHHAPLAHHGGHHGYGHGYGHHGGHGLYHAAAEQVPYYVSPHSPYFGY